MTKAYDGELVPVKSIQVGHRQREVHDQAALESLELSLKRNGQIQPIVIDRAFNLIAGGRRVQCAQRLGWSTIWAVYRDTLSKDEAELLELEENFKRLDLTWWEEDKALIRYHRLRELLDPNWTAAQTASEFFIAASRVSEAIHIVRALEEEPEVIKSMQSHTAAYGYCKRKLDRALAAETEKFLNAELDEDEDEGDGAPPELRLPSDASTPSAPDISFRRSPSRFRAAQGDFVEFASTTTGKIKYNFLHCDFPYGVGMDTSALQGTSDRHDRYEDTPELYWRLCHALTQNQEMLCQTSCHMMFWFSMKFYNETRSHFEAAGWTVNPHPLIWLKSDGKGIIPDPTRGPRQVVETALLCSRGDRKIVRPVANGIAYPSSKADALHLSEKPVEVLDHFFRMFVDEPSEVLDPTCGAGSALVAALNAGASRAFGLELNENYAAAARGRLQDALTEPGPIKFKDLDLGSISNVLA